MENISQEQFDKIKQRAIDFMKKNRRIKSPVF
jgi:hypothetical protein